ncbi:hypothetical protein BGW36DRAFT_423204 [Talaromyces proteolyticus]|uniref:Uncharacterized protein n=1 Tax=Talaromyces proteolyticus TaxID=1131652 RepID=A0AAD4L102_9EURO|nr:uncharacterized protein BGW36DRAFT_423204 [Talaromyces proteolyticus]KAH8703651.1 hypothetical protein BGW36DRAFT_423204 [Talaromyces proteolyticus]
MTNTRNLMTTINSTQTGLKTNSSAPTGFRIESHINDASTIVERLRASSLAAAVSETNIKRKSSAEWWTYTCQRIDSFHHGKVKRCSISPPIASDGGYVHITIPLEVGLEYGLRLKRVVEMGLDIRRAANHSSPYALTSPSDSPIRRLGIHISGTIMKWPSGGSNFLSRKIVSGLFNEHDENIDGTNEECAKNWRYGDDGVHLAGGWCRDGMVLLEGCVVSAMRLAPELDVKIPSA